MTIGTITRGISVSLKRVGWKKITIAIVVLLVALFASSKLLKKTAAPELASQSAPKVEVKSVTDLSSQQSGLSIAGVVESKSEATVRAEKSGQLVGVHRALGDSVAAGTIVAEIENASERASVLSAQGGVDAARASIAKITGGVRVEQRTILQTNVDSSKDSLVSSQASTVSTLLAAYAAVDNAIRGTGDQMFSNPETDSPHFNVTSSDSQLAINIQNARAQLSSILIREQASAKSISPNSDLSGEIRLTSTEIRTTRDFFDLIIRALNSSVTTQGMTATQISAFQANATAARASLTGALSSLTSAQDNLNAKAASITVAQKNLEQGQAGGQVEDVQGAQAVLKQAEGGLAAARANLEKSYIRAPISGTINSFSLKQGDYVQMATPILTIANNGALEVVAYITEGDAGEIAVGQSVTLDSGSTGVVTKIAPALDPVTKKIEVRIGVSGKSSSLINGQSVLASISRTSIKMDPKARITVPISSIKVESNRVLVFTVDPNMTLTPHEIKLGALLGDRVEVVSGLTADMEIVVDARGLRGGETVQMR